MSKLKKVLLMCTAYVLVAALAIGGTIAYLQDDDSDVNVMTLGNVSIAQHEYERVVDANGEYVVDDSVGGYKLQPFTQDKPLYPATIPTNSAEWTYESTNAMFEQVGANGGGMNVFVEPNAVDKFVFVENTGKTDAYVRTLIAFESGSLSVEEWDEVVSTSYHFSWGDPVVIGSITVENNNYVVLEYTYKGRPDKGFHENGILPAGEVTQCSLGQVYMRSTATNEDCEAIDGNKNGKYDILVLSQAVQTAGFADAKTALDAAFGKSSEKAAEWFGGVIADAVTGKSVSTADELAEALAAGEAVVLTNDITLTAPLTVDGAVNIDLHDHYIASVGIELKNGGSIKNGTIKSAGNTADFLMHFMVSGGTLTMDNVDVDVTDSMYAGTGFNSSSQACGIRVENAEVILNNCDVKVHNDTDNVYFVQAWAVDVLDAKFTMNGGSITAKCEKGTADDSVTGLDDPAFACALSADGVSTVTFNNVAVEATYFGEVFDWQDYSSDLTFNTTDKNITADDFILWWSAKLTVNHIN